MNEKEIVELYAYYSDLYFSLMQWWLSVTIGMVGIAHFFAKKINLPILLFLVGLYVAYSLYTISLVGINYGASQELIVQLEELQALDGVSRISAFLIENTNSPSSLPGRLFGICVFGGLFGSVAYLIASYVRVWRSRKTDKFKP